VRDEGSGDPDGGATGSLPTGSLPTEYLPTFGNSPSDLTTRPRRNRRTSRPVLLTLLVALGTIVVGSGSGLLLANRLDGSSSQLAGGSVTTGVGAGPSVAIPLGVTASPTATPSSSPTARPTATTTRASRSQPTRSSRPSPSATSKKPSTSSAGASASGVPAMEAAVLKLTNAERTKAGCKALTTNSKLTLAARRHSQYMADTGKHAHDGIGDGTPQTRIEATGYQWRGWGENIAWGYRSAAAVMDGWMNSPGHRANILKCSYREIGIGVDRSGTSWTQDFGIPG
jgi:uncharacterized protein YkwD